MLKKSKSNIKQYHLHKLFPEKLQFEVYNLYDYRLKNKEKAAIPHSHSFYQIVWFLKGTGEHSVDFKTYKIENNTIIFIAKDQVHYFDQNLDIRGWMIHFNESFFMHTDIDVFLKFKVFNAQQNPCYTLNRQSEATASSYLALILSELKNRNGFGHADVLRFLLKSFLINIERFHQADPSRKLAITDHYELQFYSFKELIEENFDKGLSVKEYAEKLHVSSKTLTTITNAMVGKPPSKVISERIVLASMRLLMFTSLQIGEIAFHLGFQDASYFIKYFKKHVGSSPKQFRNKRDAPR